jgi:hypothetical protein
MTRARTTSPLTRN